MRLIDADKLENELLKLHKHCEQGYYGYGTRQEGMLQMIGLAFGTTHCSPTIDAVEVIRCKECRHWQSVGEKQKCELHLSVMKAEDFCSLAERRDTE